MRSAYFLCGVFVLCIFALRTLADGPATPKATITSWTKAAASWTSDQVYEHIYYAQGEKEETLAKAMAEQTLVCCKLQDAIREKWGKGAEVSYARAVVTDTLEDDDAATEKIEGDHATITFQEETHIPTCYLIRINGKWKTDMRTYMRNLGDQFDATLRFYRKSRDVLLTALNTLKENKYKDNQELVVFLKSEYEKLEQ